MLLPWLFTQAATLSPTAVARHWSIAWVGLDSLEAIGLVSTGLLVRQGDRRYRPIAAATAALLLVDAWFDTVTAAPGRDLAIALVLAAVGEVPLALLCATTALRRCDCCRRSIAVRRPGAWVLANSSIHIGSRSSGCTPWPTPADCTSPREPGQPWRTSRASSPAQVEHSPCLSGFLPPCEHASTTAAEAITPDYA
ncbi:MULTISPECIES: hypothetical protein [unclassified Nocardia]|uniref:hypothetical protein n=1 Tax=unclassified Nocardia TaxID=2637762 RepID=UPI001CE4A42A|nr:MULTISPECIES: hypothetical protein [unclassified Nocardia]